MTDTRMKIAIYGASGYTGRQIVAELARRGAATVLVGRDRERLRIVQAELGGALRVARLDDPAALSAAVRGCRVVINAAGPFELTSAALLEAAVGAGAHYVDFAAEQASVAATFERWGAPAREAGVALAPAMGFYGALGDLLGTLVAREVERIELLTLAYAVTGWRMTPGSRAAANVVAGRRWVWRNRALELVEGEPRFSSFDYPPPRGAQPVLEDYPAPETVTLPRHLEVDAIRVLMTSSTLAEALGSEADSDADHAASTFTLVASASDGAQERSIALAGRDIYGITVPITVEAALRLAEEDLAGAVAASELFEPDEFFERLEGYGLSLMRGEEQIRLAR